MTVDHDLLYRRREDQTAPAYVESRARVLVHLRPGPTVVLQSTTYPGTPEERLLPILETASGLKGRVDFLAGFSPERIAPGSKRWSFGGRTQIGVRN
ncbi:hypothetical protein [Streptomyces sp. NBC_00306]|uniref:hypothetical protein n=1 Tax=Streptomyces sp. NBC_00306 TaxID=2975708 RepID=UPI002E2D009C|nr:hypothetical protein [Streptomyces sp. NBC_00306]